MKYVFLLGLSFMTAVFAAPEVNECNCTNCACTPESHCGCLANKGCHCDETGCPASCKGPETVKKTN